VVDNKENYFTKEMIEIPQEDSKNTVIVVKNITSFKELDVAKTNFIATVSHELKTPLASSDFSLKLLEDERNGSLTNDQKELVQNLKQDNQRMLRILSELLNLSQVETGNIQLSIQQSDPYQMLHYALEAVKVQAEQKHIEIKTETEKNLPAVKADPEKTAWVLINFLTNAIRYSPEESKVLVEIKKQINNVRFSVKDEGQGIDSRYRDKIFDRYFQIPGSSKSGTGLGLAISKEFIEAQNGKIGVETEIGMGSKFYFELLS
jgi:two-component system, NtrC family, sensor histidine kinase KinB